MKRFCPTKVVWFVEDLTGLSYANHSLHKTRQQNPANPFPPHTLVPSHSATSTSLPNVNVLRPRKPESFPNGIAIAPILLLCTPTTDSEKAALPRNPYTSASTLLLPLTSPPSPASPPARTSYVTSTTLTPAAPCSATSCPTPSLLHPPWARLARCTQAWSRSQCAVERKNVHTITRWTRVSICTWEFGTEKVATSMREVAFLSCNIGFAKRKAGTVHIERLFSYFIDCNI